MSGTLSYFSAGNLSNQLRRPALHIASFPATRGCSAVLLGEIADHLPSARWAMTASNCPGTMNITQ
jgi:hypothetical protein